MTVQEVIDHLKQFDPSEPVEVEMEDKNSYDDNERGYIRSFKPRSERRGVIIYTIKL